MESFDVRVPLCVSVILNQYVCRVAFMYLCVPTPRVLHCLAKPKGDLFIAKSVRKSDANEPTNNELTGDRCDTDTGRQRHRWRERRLYFKPTVCRTNRLSHPSLIECGIALLRVHMYYICTAAVVTQQ